MKCNQSGPGFELVSPCPYPVTITITPRAPPVCMYIYMDVRVLVSLCVCGWVDKEGILFSASLDGIGWSGEVSLSQLLVGVVRTKNRPRTVPVWTHVNLREGPSNINNKTKDLYTLYISRHSNKNAGIATDIASFKVKTIYYVFLVLAFLV